MSAFPPAQAKGNEMPHVAITGLTRIQKPKPNQGGSMVLAWFDCEVVGFRLIGCALVRTARNGLVAWAPKIEGPEGQRRSVSIVDDSIRHAMMINARAVYQALGGTDAEWIPSGDGDRARTRPDRRQRSDLIETDGLPQVEGVHRFLGVTPAQEEIAQ